MMNFEIIRDALIVILKAAELSRYRTIDSQFQSTSAEEVFDELRTVNVYYKSGNFPKSSAALNSATQHNMTFTIELMVAKSAVANLTVINDPTSTAAEIAAAMTASLNDSQLADRSMDELIRIVYQILMDGNNIDLGLPIGIANDRWLDNPDKGDPLPQGSMTVLSATMMFTCRTEEAVTGDVGVTPDTVNYDSKVNINEDPVQQTGVNIQIPK